VVPRGSKAVSQTDGSGPGTMIHWRNDLKSNAGGERREIGLLSR
jgi:hypothetical protein